MKYADGVLPGQGSPDQDFSPSESAQPSIPLVDKPVKKKYKKVTITVITQHVGDTDSEEEGPPPPPPGSPPRYQNLDFVDPGHLQIFPFRYRLKELLAMYGASKPIASQA